MKGKFLPPPGFERQTVQTVAHSPYIDPHTTNRPPPYPTSNSKKVTWTFSQCFLPCGLDFDCRVLASCPKSDFSNLLLLKLCDPTALSWDYTLLQQLLINQSSGLCHSASITAPPLFESHSHNIIGRTILIAKINLHYSLFRNKYWLFMFHYLATEYNVTYLALYLL